jgi:hypothetical protein
LSRRIFLTFLFAVAFADSLAAQNVEASSQVPQPLACGVHGDIEALCGAHHPEDIEPTPDGKYLIVTAFLDEHPTGPVGGGMDLFNLKRKTFSRMTIVDQLDKSWGDPACPGPIDEALVSHGESLAKRSDGKWALYVVNHAKRESIEMFELKPMAESWGLVWHGCEVGTHAYNDVAILPDGGFVGTYPMALVPKGAKITLRSGITGYVARWTPGRGKFKVVGTRMRFPNGVVVSHDGRYMFVNEFLGHRVLKFDLETGQEIGSVTVGFLPDNLTWTTRGSLLSAGMEGGPNDDCPKGSARPRNLSFGIVELDPVTMQVSHSYNSEDHTLLVEGVSSALRIGKEVYLGSYSSDRLVKMPW